MRFDYIIVTESNKWVSTGKNATELDLNEELTLVQEGYPDEQLVVFKAQKMESFSV